MSSGSFAAAEIDATAACRMGYDVIKCFRAKGSNARKMINEPPVDDATFVMSPKISLDDVTECNSFS